MTQTPTDALRLVPCPFCGGDVINTRSQEMTKGPAYYWHKCETCGAESEGDYGEDVAVAAWNRRAAPASPLPGGGDELTSAREVLDLIERNPVLIGLKGQVSDSLLIETGYVMVDFLKSLPAAPTGEPK